MPLPSFIHQAAVIRYAGLCPWTVTINHEIWGIFSTERAAVRYMCQATGINPFMRGMET